MDDQANERLNLVRHVLSMAQAYDCAPVLDVRDVLMICEFVRTGDIPKDHDE